MHNIFGVGCLLGLVFLLGQATTVQAAATTTSIATSAQNQVFVEKLVREYFVDVPVMIEIARCESNFRQFTDGGTVFRGGVGGGMIGVFQFYEAIHKTPALARGFDLATLEGNIGYAQHVYKQSGTQPWSACIPATISLSEAQLKLKIELLKQVVVLLKQLLELKLTEV
jgi:hypothetical protein